MPTCELHIQRTTVKDPQLAPDDEFSEKAALTFHLYRSPRHLAEQFVHHIAVMDPWKEVKLDKNPCFICCRLYLPWQNQFQPLLS